MSGSGWCSTKPNKLERSAGRAAKRADNAKDEKVAQLQENLTKKKEVVAKLMEEQVQLKKELGEL